MTFGLVVFEIYGSVYMAQQKKKIDGLTVAGTSYRPVCLSVCDSVYMSAYRK